MCAAFLVGTNNTVSSKYSDGHIMREIVPLVRSLGFKYYDWNVSSAEASNPPPTKDQIIANVVSGCKKKRLGCGPLPRRRQTGLRGRGSRDHRQAALDGVRVRDTLPGQPTRFEVRRVQFKPS
jgi:hypothetical protein